MTLTYNLKTNGISNFASLKEIAKDKYIFEAEPLSRHVGNYSATLTLTDNNKFPMSRNYIFEFIVIPNPDEKKPEVQLPTSERVKP